MLNKLIAGLFAGCKVSTHYLNRTYKGIGSLNAYFCLVQMMKHVDTNRRHMLRVLSIILLCIVVGRLYMYCASILYTNTANKHWQGKRYQARKSNPWNISMVDSCSGLLRSGDLVVRRGDDMTSFMLSQLNSKDKTYSHCGLVVIEDGHPYVYHSIGGEDNPDQIMKRETLTQWFSPANNLAIAVYRYDLVDSLITQTVEQLHIYYRQKKMFDMDFDLATDDRLYCSEMIYKVIKAATQNEGYIKAGNAYGRSFVGVDDLYLNPHTKLICQVRFK